MRINNNLSAINSLNSLYASDNALNKSLERLSSGLRINRAADDAAGLAISEKMRNQIKGLNQARKNTQDGVSLIQTAEGALNETHSILGRMRELAVQASSDTLTDDDREQVQKESDLLVDEIDRIATDTEFNTKKLLNGLSSEDSKYASGFNQIGNVLQGVDVSSNRVEPGTYHLKFSNHAAEKAMGTITRSNSLGIEYCVNVASSVPVDLSRPLTSSLGGTAYAKVVTAGNFFINEKEIRVDDGDTIEDVMRKINGAKIGVAALSPGYTEPGYFSGSEIVLIAGKDASGEIKLENGSSNFFSVVGFNLNSNGWSDPLHADRMITEAVSGTAKLVNLTREYSDHIQYESVGLLASDRITISGIINGEKRSTKFTVGNSTLEDLLSNIENNFGNVDAVVEPQLVSKSSTIDDFDERKTLSELFNNLGNIYNGKIYVPYIDTPIIYSASDSLKDFVDRVNSAGKESGISVMINYDNRSIDFSFGNNAFACIPEVSVNAISEGNLSNILGLSTYNSDICKIVVRGKDGAANAVTNVSITATDADGINKRTEFNALFNFQQVQVARDKGDYLGVAKLNSEPAEIRQSEAVAVKLESVNTELINGAKIFIGNKVNEIAGSYDKAIATIGNCDGSIMLQTGANKSQAVTVSIDDMTSTALGLKSSTDTKLSLSTRQDAQNALDKIDNAISKVSTERSKLGAFQNRLEHTVTHLGVSSENLTASESRIRDLDMAQEMSTFTRNQIIMQAGTAMIAQANQKPQGVMKLLG